MEKLTLKELAPYLPYELRFISSMDKPFDEFGRQPVWTLDGTCKLFGDYCLMPKEGHDAYPLFACRIVLRPLGDLTKEITVNGETFVPIEKLKEKAKTMFHQMFSVDNFLIRINQEKGYDDVVHWAFQDLIKWHFDVFGLIEKGLAIDINTIK